MILGLNLVCFRFRFRFNSTTSTFFSRHTYCKNKSSIVCRYTENMSALEVRKRKIIEFHGPIAAPVTPFDAAGELDTSRIFEYAQHLSEIGIKGIYLSGTTGEGYSLAIEEKMRLIDAWRDAIDRLPAEQRPLAIVHASSTVVGDIVRYARRIEQLGFDCIALLPPIYYKAMTKEHLVEYLKQILDSAAPNTPFLYYNNYSTGELNFEMDAFLELALERIPQFCAIKWSHYNLLQFASAELRFGDRIKICPGMNEILFSTMVYGCDSPILSTLSIPAFARWYEQMDAAIKRGDLREARRMQGEITAETKLLRKGGYLTAIKAELNRQLNDSPRRIFFGTPRSPIYLDFGKTISSPSK